MIRLQAGAAVADIATRGAELWSWSVAGTPLIWTPDPSAWSDTAPILFPVVGWTRGSRVLVAGRSYPLGLHGFARSMTFRLVEREQAWARLILEASPESRAMYPFAFALAVDYRLSAHALRVEMAVVNTGGEPMPYACGLHPGFRWPFAGGEFTDYAIEFAEAERDTVPVITADGLFTRSQRGVPGLNGRRLDLSPDLFAREALCLLDVRGTSLRFRHRAGAAITVALERFPHLALWSRPPGRFLSIESWTGHGDFADSDGDLMRKPSMIHLAPGETGRHAATYGYQA